MINKNDCMTILVKLSEKDPAANALLRQLLISKSIPEDVLKYIAKQNSLEAVKFYEHLRKNNNEHKSPLYKNLLKEYDPDDFEIIITLNCLLTQIFLYANKLEDKEVFLREIRADEISKVINDFLTASSVNECLKLLKLIKSDILVLEYINGRREKQ